MARAKLGQALAVFLCSTALARAFDPAEIKLPAGFKIALYAENLPQARSLALGEAPGPAVIVYVSSRGKGALPAQGTLNDKVSGWLRLNQCGGDPHHPLTHHGSALDQGGAMTPYIWSGVWPTLV